MCKTLDIEDKTLAELRTLNVRFEREQAAELSALRTEYQTMQNDFGLRKEAEEFDIENKFKALWDKYHDDIEPLDDEYRRLGVTIGTLMDKRKNADETEYEVIRQEIDSAMDRRREIKRIRREIAEQFRQDKNALKREMKAAQRKRGSAHMDAERALREKRLEIRRRYEDMHDRVRKEIANRLAEERASEAVCQ